MSRIDDVTKQPLKSYDATFKKYRGDWVAKLRFRNISEEHYPGDFITLRTKKGKKKKSRLKWYLTSWDEYDEEPLNHLDTSNYYSGFNNRAYVQLWTFTDDFEGFMQRWIGHLSDLIIKRKGTGRRMVVTELMKHGAYSKFKSKEILRIIEWLMMEVHEHPYPYETLPKHVKSRRDW